MTFKALLLIKLFIFVLSNRHAVDPRDTLMNICANPNQKISFTHLNELNSINLREAYKTGQGIGGGAFGQVRSYPLKKGEMAIKMALFKNSNEIKLAASELSILIDINKREDRIAPPYFGCQFSPFDGTHGVL